MLRTTAAALVLLGVGFAQPATAGVHPPKDAEPLSKILHEIEQEDRFSHFEEIEWDDDGYWEIEYVIADRVKVETKVRPKRAASRVPSKPAAAAPTDPSAPNP